MKKILIILIILIVPICSTAQAQKRIAVLVNGNTNIRQAKQQMETYMTSTIVKTKGYTAIERNNEFLNAIENEINYQLNGNVAINQIAKIGEQFGAQYIAIITIDSSQIYHRTENGSLKDAGTEFYISGKIIDVETSQIVASEEETSANSIEIEDIGKNITDGLICELKYPNLIDEVVIRGPFYRTSDISDGIINHSNSNMEMITDPRIARYIMRELEKRDGNIRTVMYGWDKIERTKQIDRKTSMTTVTYNVYVIQNRSYIYNYFKTQDDRFTHSEIYTTETKSKGRSLTTRTKDSSFVQGLSVLYCPSYLLNGM